MSNMPETEIIEEQFFDEAVQEETKTCFVNFVLANEWYGVEISNVKAVVRVPSITHLPGAPIDIVGIINLRGKILTVSDLKRVFGLEKTKKSGFNRIVVVEYEGIETGLLVDNVLDPVEVPVSKIDPPMSTLQGGGAEFIAGETRIGSKIMGILKLEKLLK